MEDSVNRHSVECSGTLPDAASQRRRSMVRELEQALEHMATLQEFAYQQGFHELGYDPLATVRAALGMTVPTGAS